MNSQGSGPFQKTCLLTLFQAIIIGIAFALISMNSNFDSATDLELKCMNLSDSHKLCISVFEKDFDKVPPNSPVKVRSLHANRFKVLEFEQNPRRLNSKYKNEYQEYFHLINYNHEIDSINNVQMDTEVKEIKQFLEIKKTEFSRSALNQTTLGQSSGLAVMYFLVDNRGPMVPESQVSVSHQTYSSVNLNLKVCIISCLVGIVILMGWASYYAIDTMKDNSRPPNESLCDNPHINKVSRPTRFLLYFGLGNLIVYSAANKLWSSFGLEKVIKMLGINQNTISMIEQQVSQTSIDLFPQWLFLGCFIYLVCEKYYGWGNVTLILLSGVTSALLYLVPSGTGQMVFELTFIILGLLLTLANKPSANTDSKFTVSILFTAINLTLMSLTKMKWGDFQSDQNDFMLRFFYNNVFITNNILSILYADGQITSKTDRKYIPYEQYSMEEETQFDEHSHAQHAEKI